MSVPEVRADGTIAVSKGWGGVGLSQAARGLHWT